ncbi:TfuA-like protein [Streptomyces griseoluteus]|uniref:TfuA-like protein n=1 Tax=Streptomyces griseoluteus TaxID=29306 RepID=UPI00365126CD
MTTSPVTLFAGPTIWGMDAASWADTGVTLRPPARRGDIDSLLPEEPGILAIADGTFHSYPAVGHAEIRTALEKGWQIWGLCSMGAIRAAEMHTLGMRGFGDVFEAYAEDPDLDDDEVALLHSSEPPFRPMSEPMLHLRRFLADLTDRQLLTGSQSSAIVSELKQRWYADRTMGALRNALTQHAALPATVLHAEMANFDAFRTKQHDLLRFLKEQPWQPTAS